MFELSVSIPRSSIASKTDLQRVFPSHSFHSQVDSVIDICSDLMNLRSVIYVCKQKLEEIKDDYKIEVRLVKYSKGHTWSRSVQDFVQQVPPSPLCLSTVG